MSERQRISEAEWVVMEAVWVDHPVGALEVAERIGAERGWSIKTVKTLLERLVKKGVLAHRTEGQRYLYHPLVSREESVRDESESFLSRVLGGSASPFLAYFVREGELGAEDIDELRRLLDERERAARTRGSSRREGDAGETR